MKAHVLTVLHSVGYAPLNDLSEALVPSRDLAKAALHFYQALSDREWIAYRDLCNTVSWGARCPLKEVVEWTSRLAASALVPTSQDADSLTPEEIEFLLGGRAEFVLDPRPRFRLSANRAWWRAIGGPPGDLLKEELAAEEEEAGKGRQQLLATILNTLRTTPHRNFIGTDELDDWATRLDSAKVKRMRENGTRQAENLLSWIVLPALLAAEGIDLQDSAAAEKHLGGSYKMEKGQRGQPGVRWYSAAPETYPE